ncbi:SDR family NAD(P)-dependent oxidoreductase, partial [Staphylococcus epidermidis]|uniref:SDR family NAD(P)-dependent oxidoreductase n=1 Tax=Staphylococcus epidermidis TaxID=1282 RepID=UPI0011A2C30E
IQEDIKPIIQTTINHFPTLHIIINNPPFQNSIPTHQISIHHSQKLIHINLTPPFVPSTQPINQFLNQNKKPTIINISTLHHTIPCPNYLHYPPSKGALKLIMETMSIEYAQYRIRI